MIIPLDEIEFPLFSIGVITRMLVQFLHCEKKILWEIEVKERDGTGRGIIHLSINTPSTKTLNRNQTKKRPALPALGSGGSYGLVDHIQAAFDKPAGVGH